MGKHNCPCSDIIRCIKCARQICFEVQYGDVYSCTPLKKNNDVCEKCTEEILNENER